MDPDTTGEENALRSWEHVSFPFNRSARASSSTPPSCETSPRRVEESARNLPEHQRFVFGELKPLSHSLTLEETIGRRSARLEMLRHHLGAAFAPLVSTTSKVAERAATFRSGLANTKMKSRCGSAPSGTCTVICKVPSGLVRADSKML